MLKHKLGHVVNVASMAGQSGTNKLVDYCSSKFAAVGLDKAFRAELFVQGHSDYIKNTVHTIYQQKCLVGFRYFAVSKIMTFSNYNF